MLWFCHALRMPCVVWIVTDSVVNQPSCRYLLFSLKHSSSWKLCCYDWNFIWNSKLQKICSCKVLSVFLCVNDVWLVVDKKATLIALLSSYRVLYKCQCKPSMTLLVLLTTVKTGDSLRVTSSKARHCFIALYLFYYLIQGLNCLFWFAVRHTGHQRNPVAEHDDASNSHERKLFQQLDSDGE